MSYKKNANLFAQLENKTGYEKTKEEEVLNPYVNFHKYAPSQELHNLLVSEAVQMRGTECYYMRRELVNFDLLFGEDTESRFTTAKKIAVYIETFDGYEGQNDFFSKFGMQVNDEMTFTLSPSLFRHQVDGEKPKESDLLYFPMDNSLFELTWIEENQPFHQLGQDSQMKCTAQKFIYSGEEIDVKFDPSNYTDADEFAPVNNLDGRADIAFNEYEEDDAIADEALEFVEEFDVCIGKGTDESLRDPSVDPFNDFEQF